MNRNETIAILGVLKTAYPRFYQNLTKEDAEKTIALWQEMFAEDNPQLVTLAVKNLINTFKFPPTIAEVREQIYKLQTKEKPAIDYWAEAYRMISNGLYMTKEEFEQASEPVKRFFGNVNQVRELAKTDSDTVNTVTKGQFLKQIEAICEEQKQKNIMPKKMQEQIEAFKGGKNEKLTIGH